MQKIKSILAIAFAATLFACGGKQKEQSPFPSDDNSIPVLVAAVQGANSRQSITATGLVTTETEVKYSFKIGGVVDKTHVEEGAFFKKGQLLASLKLNEIEAGVIQAQLGLEKAGRDYQRVANLYRDSVATLEQLQNAKTQSDLLQKQLDALDFNKRYAFIYATEPGFVTKKIASEGEVVAGGFPVLATNGTGSSAWVVRLGLCDKDWANLQLNDPALVSLDAFPGRQFKGKVSKKALAADPSSGSFSVEVKLELGDAKPAIGMYAKAVIQTGKQSSFSAIPYDALVEADGNRAFVFVPAQGNAVRKVPIVIQSFDNESVQVQSGLEGISEVIVSNSAFLNENSTITLQKQAQ